MESESTTASASKAFEDAEETMDEAGGDKLRGDTFAGMDGDRIDVDLLNNEIGLKDCHYLFPSIAAEADADLFQQWTPKNSISRT